MSCLCMAIRILPRRLLNTLMCLTVLPGVHMGEGAVAGSMSLVNFLLLEAFREEEIEKEDLFLYI